MHDDAPPHSEEATASFFGLFGYCWRFADGLATVFARFEPHRKLLVHPEKQIYTDGHTFSSNAELWKPVKDTAAFVPPAQINKMTHSTNDRLF